MLRVRLIYFSDNFIRPTAVVRVGKWMLNLTDVLYGKESTKFTSVFVVASKFLPWSFSDSPVDIKDVAQQNDHKFSNINF